ncbi:MAG: hypothetical protein MZU84_01560 [Sphingobacterium sp.]|nr:hypothetical protein [Sphingobacterium sp.]
MTVGYDFAQYGGKGENTIPEVPVHFVDTAVMETGAYVLIPAGISKEADGFCRFALYSIMKFLISVWIPQIRSILPP